MGLFVKLNIIPVYYIEKISNVSAVPVIALFSEKHLFLSSREFVEVNQSLCSVLVPSAIAALMKKNCNKQ